VNYTHTRPIMFGYIRTRLLPNNDAVVATGHRLQAYAHAEGYSLELVFFEQPDTTPSAFEALLHATREHGVRAIVVPDLQHLEVLGAPPALNDFVVRATGAAVLEADAVFQPRHQ
jgi:hypothetical protein